MSNMSTGEFKRYVNKIKFSKIAFDCSDQENNNSCSPLLFSLSFDSVEISLRPDIIALKSSSGAISFSNIHKIELETTNEIGSAIIITCKNQDKFSRYKLFFIL